MREVCRAGAGRREWAWARLGRVVTGWPSVSVWMADVLLETAWNRRGAGRESNPSQSTHHRHLQCARLRCSNLLQYGSGGKEALAGMHVPPCPCVMASPVVSHWRALRIEQREKESRRAKALVNSSIINQCGQSFSINRCTATTPPPCASIRPASRSTITASPAYCQQKRRTSA